MTCKIVRPIKLMLHNIKRLTKCQMFLVLWIFIVRIIPFEKHKGFIDFSITYIFY